MCRRRVAWVVERLCGSLAEVALLGPVAVHARVFRTTHFRAPVTSTDGETSRARVEAAVAAFLKLPRFDPRRHDAFGTDHVEPGTRWSGNAGELSLAP